MDSFAHIYEFFIDNGYVKARHIKGLGYCAIKRFAFTAGLVVGIDATGYRGRYCYANRKEAEDALLAWDGAGDPSGDWIKYKGEGGERSKVK